MVQVQLTGDVKNGRIGVKFVEGSTAFARLSVTGPLGVIPSDKWFTDNKDKFLGLVEFEGGYEEKPVLIGFLPLKTTATDDYDAFNNLIKLTKDLLDAVTKGKVLTQLGPQTFMPDTQAKFKQISQDFTTLEEKLKKL